MRPPTAPVPDYSWLPPKKEKDYEHACASFSKTGLRPNEYSIHPDWISEEMKPMTPFGRRRFRPWAFEFQGARHYPWGSVEQRVAEENAARQTIENDPCPQEENLPTAEEKATLLPALGGVYTSEARPSWSGKTTREGLPAYHPHNAYNSRGTPRNGSMQFSRHLYTGDYAKSHEGTAGIYSGDAEPFIENPRYAEYFSHNRHPPFSQPLPADPEPVVEYTSAMPTNGIGVYDPSTFQKIPMTPRQRTQEVMISSSAKYQPGSERPRFERPHMNFTNAMWMPYPPAREVEY